MPAKVAAVAVAVLAAAQLGRDVHRGGPGADSARTDRPYDRLTNVEST